MKQHASLTEVVVLIEVQLIVHAPHTELLGFRPAGTPVRVQNPSLITNRMILVLYL